MKKLSVLMLLSVVLIGCSTTAPIVVKNANEQALKKLDSERISNNSNAYLRDPLSINKNGSVFLGKPFSIVSRVNLPISLTVSDFVYGEKNPLALSGHLNKLSSQEQISIFTRGDALEELGMREGKNTGSGLSNVTGDSASKSISQIKVVTGDGPTFPIPSFDGSIAEFLDLVTSKSGLFWEWQNGRVEIFRNTRKTFVINTDAQSFMLSGKVSSDSSGSSAGASVSSNSSQSLTSARVFDNWTDIIDQIKTHLTYKGIMSANKAVATITVVDTPPALRQVSNLIDNFNRSLEKRMIVDVHVIEVAQSVSSNYGVDWNAIVNNARSVVSLATLPRFTAGDGSIAYTLNDPSSRADGASLLIKALAEQGFSSSVRHLTANVQNGMPHPFQDIVETHYVSSTKTTTTNENTSTEIQTDIVTEGVTMFVRPQLTSEGKVLVNFSYTSGNVLELNQVSAGDISITTPKKHLVSTFSSALLRDEQTVLLTGFRQNIAKSTKAGVGHQDAWALGGNRGDASNKTDIALLVKVSLLD